MTDPIHNQILGGFALAGALTETANYQPVTPHPKQALFLALDDVEEALFGGATGGGKTISLLADALKYVHVPHYSALLLRRTFPELKQEGGLIAVAHEWLSSTDAKWNEQDKTWSFPSGATLKFGYMDNENDKYRYQGGEYHYIGFDELTQFSESQYTYLFSRLRRREDIPVPLRIRGATNPGGIGGKWVFDRFIPEEFTPAQARELKVWYKTHDDGHVTAFVPSLLDDNPSLDRDSYMRSLMQLDEITRAQYISGDWLIQVRGDILYTYSEAHSVITWEMFEEVFGYGAIPDHWKKGVYLDWGTTVEHPCAISWFATAAQNSPLPGAVFLYRGILLDHECTAVRVAHRIRDVMTVQERQACRAWQMSHEASSERMEFNMQGLPFSSWPTGKRRGIEQLKNAFDLTMTDRSHPFKPSLTGRPALYLIVDSNELVNHKTDAGLSRWRSEFMAYHWDRLKSGEAMTQLVPYPLYNDAVDTVRAAAADYWPYSAQLTAAEQLYRDMPEAIKPSLAPDAPKPTVNELMGQQLWLNQEIEKRTQKKRDPMEFR
ncbi:MAG: hypothetical protein E6Q97_39285 [Desulfurellales bacterium]|nr:MAG: hypothetical protein E6Q97_39285 [Desulfurellales bacterium]